MRKGSKGKVKRRKSIITIIIVVLIIAVAAIFTINYMENRKVEEDEGKQYITHLDEEDMMISEYDKINSELNGIYAFAIVEDKLVAIKNRNNVINIIQIDPQKEYDYLYNDAKLYLLEKESGVVSVIPLNAGEYTIENSINLNCKVDSFEVYEGEMFFISDAKLLKYSNGDVEELENDITAKNFVIKNDEIYFVKQGNLLKEDMQNTETQIAQNVNEIYYYSYYERNRLIYDVQYDDENIFKNVYNFYTGEIYNSVKNNTYFIPYNSSEYIYLTNDRKSIMQIIKSGSSKYIFNSETEIDDIVFLKEGYLSVDSGEDTTSIKISTKKEELADNIIDFHNIKYLK
ncbi:MAG: hypothetical protein J6A15_03910 [Clostridia bacterium]|nr:hypothetical protein [Clostridia bacterium]